MKELVRLFILACIGSQIYMAIEIAYRGYTHWTMGIVGGICFILIGGINEYLSWDLLFWIQAIIGGILVTIVEFISGILLNVILKLNIWDYSNVPFNVLGQICLPFTFIWMLLSMIAIVIDDYCRYFLFKEEFPHYKFFNLKGEE